MSDVIGRGIIELGASSSGLNAAIADARKRIKDLGDTTKQQNERSAKSIDKYVQSLQTQAAVQGKSNRETELYKLALRGASDEQLKAANSALKLNEGYQRGLAIGDSFRSGLIQTAKLAAAAAAALGGAAIAFDQMIKKAGNYQDLAEKTGDTAENIASLAVAAGTAGIPMEAVAAAAVKLSKNLVGVDDESKAAGAAIKALGLNIEDLKKMGAAERLETISKAFNSFADSAAKGDVAVAAFGKTGADLLPFFKELGAEGGRQSILLSEQIRLADEYSDKQAKLRTQVSLYAQSLATQAIPALTELTGAIKEATFQTLGIDAATGKLRSNNGIQDFAERGVGSLAHLIDWARKLVTAFQFVGETIGVTAALAGAVTEGSGDIAKGALTGDAKTMFEVAGRQFRAVTSILRDAREQGKKYTQESLSVVEEFDKRMAARNSKRLDNAENDPRRLDRQPPKQLNFSGAVKPAKKAKVDNSLEQEAKAQLAFDLEQIRKESSAIIDIFTNTEKIIEAKRSAGLVDERDYYETKRSLLVTNAQEQERAITAEIDRLKEETFAGKNAAKERLDNDRKILDSQAKLEKVRKDASASLTVLGIQEKSALGAIEQGFRDAEAAAEEYLDTIRRGNALDLAGFGVGNQERGRMAGRAQIEDRYNEQRQQLEKERRANEAANDGELSAQQKRKYDNELDRIRRFQATALTEYDAYYAVRLEKERDFNLGASEALQNYYDEAQKAGKQIEDALTNAFQGAEDALVEFVKTGKLDFKSLADSIITDLIRIAVKQQMAALMGSSGAVNTGGGGSGWAGWASMIAGFFGGGSTVGVGFDGYRAVGGPVKAGGMYQVNERGPELLNVAGKQYLMMGDQGGSVTANGGGQKVMNVVQNFHVSQPASKQTQSQVMAAASQGLKQGERNL